MSSYNSRPIPEDPATPEELQPVPRSFPVPRRRVELEYEEPVAGWQQWTVRGLIGTAVVTAGIAAWIKFRPHDTPAPPPTTTSVVAEPEVIPPGPPDAARDIYFDLPLPEIPEPPPAVVETPPDEAPPAPSHPLTDLESRYLGALTAARSHVPETDRPQFTAEIARLSLGAPLPAPQDGIHPELARLQSIYRLQLKAMQSRR